MPLGLVRRREALSTGVRGEKAALKYLRKNGYEILASNFSNSIGRRMGEIDIIAKEGDELVFVEVKTRIIPKFGISIPEESITPLKLHKLSKIASFYISQNNLFDLPYRFDAITLVASPGDTIAALKHIKNIFI